MTRIMREKTYGQYMRNELCKRMWEDCEARINKLAVSFVLDCLCVYTNHLICSSR